MTWAAFIVLVALGTFSVCVVDNAAVNPSRRGWPAALVAFACVVGIVVLAVWS